MFPKIKLFNNMQKTFDTLYTIDSTGKTRVWFMEQSNEKHRTVSGVKDSNNLVYSDWTICDGKNLGKKNETDAIVQTTKEIEAKYKKQLKTGYARTESSACKGTSYVECMLAKNYKDYQNKINFSNENWIIQCKFNGNRCIATKDGLFTRKGEKYSKTVEHINNSLKNFFAKYPDAVLDGELYNYDLRQKLNQLSSLVRKTVHITDEDIKNSEKIVKFYVYDGYGFDNLNEDTEYSKRKLWIDTNLVVKFNYIKKVDSFEIKNEKDLTTHFTKFIKDGEEGGILRKQNSYYEHKRSKYLLKIKAEDDSEATILDITDGDGNWAGAATNVTLKWNNKIFDAVFKGEYETRVEILKNKKDWLGKTVTFLYFGLTGLNTPNYARVDPQNCFKTDR